MAPDPSERRILDDLVADLYAAGHLRTWSVIVSIFGDTALSRGSRIPASALAAILAPLGIGQGAMRTALSRLAKDGWIESVRSGRTSTYRLTGSALSASGIASQAIYAPVRPSQSGPPHLLVWSEATAAPVDAQIVQLRRGVGIWQGGPIPDRVLAGALIATKIKAPVPDWVQTAFAGPELSDQLRRLVAQFRPLSDLMGGPNTLPPVDCVAARAALIHTWRRLALRLPSVPENFLPDDWPEPACRRFVLGLHSALSVFADQWLDEHLNEGSADEVADMSQNSC